MRSWGRGWGLHHPGTPAGVFPFLREPHLAPVSVGPAHTARPPAWLAPSYPGTGVVSLAGPSDSSAVCKPLAPGPLRTPGLDAGHHRVRKQPGCPQGLALPPASPLGALQNREGPQGWAAALNQAKGAAGAWARGPPSPVAAQALLEPRHRSAAAFRGRPRLPSQASKANIYPGCPGAADAWPGWAPDAFPGLLEAPSACVPAPTAL